MRNVSEVALLNAVVWSFGSIGRFSTGRNVL